MGVSGRRRAQNAPARIGRVDGRVTAVAVSLESGKNRSANPSIRKCYARKGSKRRAARYSVTLLTVLANRRMVRRAWCTNAQGRILTRNISDLSQTSLLPGALDVFLAVKLV